MCVGMFEEEKLGLDEILMISKHTPAPNASSKLDRGNGMTPCMRSFSGEAERLHW